ncbi:GntR family transcriptional regulator [Pseudooceanicola sediminis]|uniref:GntR family transcriptional regulator n=1 Tax=Pseudooceanicola sediminis TaxID=2211117 RepID=A0A399J9S3_9RHOB|nr:GntR family transcriptional regulator [Pseudooceanicola sediminis]KAA2316771.1 GntR family transcriptional regulator [Puniceibacterium sp. HSS470]RII40772.1 GntR family transcriptional regulator [Pseudooceanicola sediminis]|tara:strand:+ start:260264 stop:261043 length:780 start_codon:yes stop_codon:yes gene_type:complete
MEQPTVTTGPEDIESAAGTRQQQVADTLRDLIVTGQLDPDRKHSEAALAERLGVSRTPVRHALAVLVEEGVMRRAGGRGYVVRQYDANDVAVALEIRSAVEGLAARKVSQQGLSQDVAATLDACLAEGDAMFRPGESGPVDEARYSRMNEAFHEAIAVAAGGTLFGEVRAVLDRVPFGAPSAIRFHRMDPVERRLHLQHAHLQHHYIVAAIRARDAARAEALFREHGEMIKVSLGLTRGPWQRTAGSGLPISPGVRPSE